MGDGVGEPMVLSVKSGRLLYRLDRYGMGYIAIGRLYALIN